MCPGARGWPAGLCTQNAAMKGVECLCCSESVPEQMGVEKWVFSRIPGGLLLCEELIDKSGLFIHTRGILLNL